MDKLKVALVFGGKSGEHEVSIVSAYSVYKALDPKKYDVTLVGIDKSGRWLLPDKNVFLTGAENPRLIRLNEAKKTVSLVPFQAEKQLIELSTDLSTQSTDPKNFDIVLPILHGTYGEDGTIQGLLELANLPYVGSGVLGSSVGMDKEVSKRVFRDAGIPVVPYVSLKKKIFESDPKQFLNQIKKELGFPCFVKPANMGSSVGVAKIKSENEALDKIKTAFEYDTKVLVEKAVEARELECAVLGNELPKASIVGEIVPNPKHEFYSYEAKYIDAEGAALFIPADNLKSETQKKVQEYAVKAFQALECSGLARVDFFLDKKTGELYLNEINTMPGFTPISMYPKLWEATGISYGKLIDTLILLALERFKEKKALKTSI